MTSKNYPIWIEFFNRQVDEMGQENIIKVQSEGTYYAREKEDVIFYRESAVQEDKNFTFSMAIPHGKKEIFMNRFGDYKLKIHFEEGTHYESSLDTPYGLISIDFITQALDVDKTEKGGEIAIQYLMDLNHSKPIRNEVSLKYRFFNR